MVENGSWSLTFEEVSWFSSICVCLYLCLALKKYGIILLKVTNQTSPAMQVLCKKEGEAEESCMFLFK